MRMRCKRKPLHQLIYEMVEWSIDRRVELRSEDVLLQWFDRVRQHAEMRANSEARFNMFALLLAVFLWPSLALSSLWATSMSNFAPYHCRARFLRTEKSCLCPSQATIKSSKLL